jgi:hypothetical protein
MPQKWMLPRAKFAANHGTVARDDGSALGDLVDCRANLLK